MAGVAFSDFRKRSVDLERGGAEEPHELLDPMILVAEWLEAARAARQPLPEAMTLATASVTARPTARMVILRGIDHGLVFFTDRESDKGAELAANPQAAIVLHWLAPEHRQIRATGGVETVTAAEADEYWLTRRREVKTAAAAWVQSKVVSGREELEERLRSLAAANPSGAELTRPGRWCGYRVVPVSVEFWQQADDGLHDRWRCTRTGESWTVERLSP
jgi:pyridoxamine 5'-phosphate oxidase